jgi:hypothetical protein
MNKAKMFAVCILSYILAAIPTGFVGIYLAFAGFPAYLFGPIIVIVGLKIQSNVFSVRRHPQRIELLLSIIIMALFMFSATQVGGSNVGRQLGYYIQWMCLLLAVAVISGVNTYMQAKEDIMQNGTQKSPNLLLVLAGAVVIVLSGVWSVTYLRFSLDYDQKQSRLKQEESEKEAKEAAEREVKAKAYAVERIAEAQTSESDFLSRPKEWFVPSTMEARGTGKPYALFSRTYSSKKIIDSSLRNTGQGKAPGRLVSVYAARDSYAKFTLTQSSYISGAHTSGILCSKSVDGCSDELTVFGIMNCFRQFKVEHVPDSRINCRIVVGDQVVDIMGLYLTSETVEVMNGLIKAKVADTDVEFE